MIAYVPPFVVKVHVTGESTRGVRLWLPFVLLWPLLAVLFAFALLVSLTVDVVLILVGARYHHYTRLLLQALRVLSEVRGTHVKAHTDDSRVDIDIY